MCDYPQFIPVHNPATLVTPAQPRRPPTRHAADRRTAAAAPRPRPRAGACWVRRRFSRGFGRSHMVRPASPRPIDRMARVQRPPIEANIGAETVRLDEPLRTIVAVLAQALKRAKPKLVNVAAMWFDMIADCCGRGRWRAPRIFAKWMLEQLVLPDPATNKPWSYTTYPTSSVGHEAPIVSQPLIQCLAWEPTSHSRRSRPGYALLARRQALLGPLRLWRRRSVTRGE